MSYTCRIFGLALEANRSIPGVPPAKVDNVDVQLCLGELPAWAARQSPTSEAWYTSEYKDESGHPALKVFELSSGEFFRFSYYDQTEFVIDREGTRIWATWPTSLTVEDTATYLLGPIMGFVLQLRGTLSLHASAIEVGDKAILLAGPAGSGKSTTAAAFANRGYRILAEDVATLEDKRDSFLVLPAYPCIRLWPASVRVLYGPEASLPRLTPTWDKRYLDLQQEQNNFAADPISLAAIFLLGERKDDPAAPYAAAVTGPQALISLIANIYTGHLMDRQTRARGFDLLSRVQAKVPVKQITPHSDPARLGELCDKILEEFEPQVSSIVETTV